MELTLLSKTLDTKNCQTCPENKKFRLDQIRSNKLTDSTKKRFWPLCAVVAWLAWPRPETHNFLRQKSRALLNRPENNKTLHYVLDAVFVAPGAAGSAAKVAYTNCAL